MKFKILVFVLGLAALGNGAENSDALRECSNLHHLEFQNLPNSHGEYSNSNCALKCSVGEKILSHDSVNEGFPCPADSNGICQNGQCKLTTPGIQTEAQRECGNLHHIDFHSGHSTGTTYQNYQCSLKCVLNGSVVSENAVNEGYPCPGANPVNPAESEHICRAGSCKSEPRSGPVTMGPLATGPVTTFPVTVAPTTKKPESTVFTDFTIHTIDVNINQAKLNSEHNLFFAMLCIKDTGYDDAPCVQTCHTTYYPSETSNPKWFYHCALAQMLHLEDKWMFMDVYTRETPLSVKVGSFHQKINHLFDENYHRVNGTGGTHLNYSFQKKLPLIGHAKTEVGDIDVTFTFDLSRKAGH